MQKVSHYIEFATFLSLWISLSTHSKLGSNIMGHLNYLWWIQHCVQCHKQYRCQPSVCCWIKEALSSNLLMTGRAVLPQQTRIDLYISVKKANCIWTHNADKRSLMGLTAKMILPPEKPLPDDTTNCVKSCLIKRYLRKAVKLDYIITGNQGISTAAPTHSAYTRRQTPQGMKGPENKQWFIILSHYCFSPLAFADFHLIINMKSKLTLFTVSINCVSWCTICQF